ncbi:MAG: protein kinase [Verrucomicrobia bacterium]|nr:protein kinase [Verrucomicrobiota bacterium]
MSSPPGSSLDYAHFRVVRRADGNPWVLGIGGMGITYKAEDTRLQVGVALKVIHPARLGDEEARRLFVREARAAARIHDPHVVSVVYLDDSEERPFCVMELVEGVSLQTWMRGNGAMPPALAVAFAEQIAHGLAAIHQQDIVHRDLKPANIMVVAHPPGHPRHRIHSAAGGCQLKIIDFGLARGIESEEHPSTDGGTAPTIGFRGTAAYSSPEQCDEATDLDARTDLYALGCIFWEMLAGKPPFVGKSHRDLINQQVGKEPPWRDLEYLPECIREVLAKLLAKKREDRYADAQLADAALLNARRQLDGNPETTVPNLRSGQAPWDSTQAVASTTSGRRAWPWVAATTALSLLAVGLVGWVLSRPTPAPPEDVARRRAIAVVPFLNRSSEKDTEHFVEGVHEDILTSLGKVRAFRVVSVKSSLKVKDGREERRDFAGELGVGSVLEGSVRRQGSLIRVSTQLSDAATGRQLWAETYDRELTNAFEIQSAVARDIARSLETTLTADENASLGAQYTNNQAAYEQFLRARAAQRRAARTRESQYEVVAQFERAIALDPKFALAHAYLSRSHSLIYLFAVDPSPARVQLMRQSAERALELQPGLPEAHVALGRVLSYAERQHLAALREYRIALAIEPGNAEAHFESGHLLRRLGRWEEALAAHRQAADLDPDDPDKLNSLGTCLYSMRRYAEAEVAYRRGVTRTDNAFRHLNLLLAEFERSGDWPAFQSSVRGLLPRIPADQRWRIQRNIGDLREALVTLGQLKGDEVQIIFQRLPKSFAEGTVLKALGSHADAASAFRAALERLRPELERAPEDAPLRMKVAYALAGAGEWVEARQQAVAALQRLPAEADAVLHRELRSEYAQVLAEIGEPAEACRVLSDLMRQEMPLTLGMLRHYPEWAPLKGFPAFEELIRR